MGGGEEAPDKTFPKPIIIFLAMISWFLLSLVNMTTFYESGDTIGSSLSGVQLA